MAAASYHEAAANLKNANPNHTPTRFQQRNLPTRATEGGGYNVWYRIMSYYIGNVYRDYFSKAYLFSVRCLQE